VAFSPDGKTLLTGCNDGKVRAFSRPRNLPDELDRVATWVEVLTGLTLEKQQGSIKVLDHGAWLAAGARLEQLGGRPEVADVDRAALAADEAATAARSAAVWKRAVELEPKSAANWFSLGVALALAGDKQAGAQAFQKADELGAVSPRLSNQGAWLLSTDPDPGRRDANRAVALAKKTVELVPNVGAHWNTLGVAHYRAGNWNEAAKALRRSTELGSGGDAFDWFFMAMAHWQLCDKKAARTWYDKALDWTEKNRTNDEELWRFRAEAAALLGPDLAAGQSVKADPAP
jgi:tetratricopeptide (TPR) repeat protein